MTEILLIRHGETLWNQQGRMQGQNDSPLTPTGLEQARKLARRLKDVAFTALYSSDLGRAHQTARCIADATGHDIIADQGLRERSFGIFEGLTNAEIRVRHPGDYAIFARRDAEYVVPGGESASAFRRRVVQTLEAIAARHGGETITVVSHGLVLDALYRTASGMSYEVQRGFPLLNCSVNTFRRGPEGWLAVTMCDVGHLAEDEVTRYSDAAVVRPVGASGA
jgi:probable phosphoglycerate mutase